MVAVLVVHDGDRWLPRTLGALAGLDRRPDVVVAVDAGSSDHSGVLLDTAVGTAPVHVVDAVVSGRARDGFGASVRRGLAVADRLREADATVGPAEEWVWLLHDDSAPDPGALDELLSVVRASPTLAVAGCKLLGWDDPRTLVEVGATVSPGGRRLTDVTAGDIDQGQHDARGDVLLVSTAGMLVRRSVLDHVGGFDPAIPLVGDDVDLCMRVRRAGHRVTVVPTATVRHAGALEAGQRPADALHSRLGRRAGSSAPRAGGRVGGLESARRRHWLHSRLVQAPVVLLPLLWLWVLLVAPVRAAAWLLRGHPGRAWAELDATVRLVGRGWRVQSSRWRARRARAVPVQALRLLQRSRSQVLREDLDAWRARRSLRREERAEETEGDVPLEAVESGPVDDDLIDLDLGASGPARRLFGHPLTYLVPLVLLVGALPGVRTLLRPPPVDADGVALPVTDPTAGLDAVELWSRATTGWRDVGMGVVAAADPATAVWAVLTAATSLLTRGALAVATLGDARLAVGLVSPVLALLLAWWALRRLTGSRAAAAAGAATWALLPTTGLLGAVHAGDWLVHALLPLLAVALVGCLGRRPLGSLAAAGLLGTVVVALSPATWPVLLVGAVLVGVVGGPRTFASWRACLPLVAVASPALVWAAWLPALRRDPRVLLVDPASVDPTLVDLPTAAGLVPRLADVPAVLRGDVAASTQAVGLVVAGALALLAVGAVLGALLLVLSLSRRAVPAAWSAALLALVAAATGLVAVLLARGQALQPSLPVSAAALAVGLTVALLVRDLHDPDRPRPRDSGGPRRVVAGVGLTTRWVVPVAVVGTALAVGLLVPAQPLPEGLPSPALVGAQSPQATRTLLLTGSGTTPGVTNQVDWQVVAGQPGPGQASVPTVLAGAPAATRPGERRLADAVSSALGDGTVPGDEVAGALAQVGVGWVVVRDAPTVDVALAQRAGLVRTALEQGRTTWRVDSGATAGALPPTRARVVDATGEDVLALDLRDGVADLPAGTPGRVLALADSSRAGWTATVDGAPLSRTTLDGWAQGFLLPASAGELVVEQPSGAAPGSRVVSVVALAALLLALVWPARRRRPRLQPAPRQVRVSGSGRVRTLRTVGRTALAGAVAVLLLGVLAASTGVGRAPGALSVGRQLDGVPVVATTAGAVGTAVERLAPAAADPVRAAPLVRLATAGSVQTCPTSPRTGASEDPTSGSSSGPASEPLPDAVAGAAATRGLGLQVVRDGDDRGLRLAGCATTAGSSWVLLGGTGVGERPSLVLANPGETGAVVDVRLGGPDGPVETPAATGILVAPGEQTEVALDALAPDLGAVMAHVVARAGTVAVLGSETGLEGLVPQGTDDQTAQVAAAQDLVLPVVRVPASRGTARLVVGSVGDTPAVVTVRTLRAVDPADPEDLAAVEDPDAVDDPDADPAAGAPVVAGDPVVAPAGGVVEVDLSDLEPGTYALRLSADVPLVAAATWSAQRGGAPADGLTGVPRDRVWVQAVPAGSPWSRPVALPLGPLLSQDGAVDGAVLSVLPAGDRATVARLTALDGDGGSLGSTSVAVPAGGAPVELPLPDVLAGVDREALASLEVTSAAGVHLGVRVSLDDADGTLLGATSVPGASGPAPAVRLVRR